MNMKGNDPHYEAHRVFRKALEDKEIERPQYCEQCGRRVRGWGLKASDEHFVDSIDGHHDDYSRPLDVIWLCGACHGAVHNQPQRVDHHQCLRTLTIEETLDIRAEFAAGKNEHEIAAIHSLFVPAVRAVLGSSKNQQRSSHG
jgi:hypothetical protein